MDISPDRQNINNVFSNTIYHIDFYQREYRWTKEPISRLLDDIFYKFNEHYDLNKSYSPNDDIIDSKYPWYYLSTYITNTISGKAFIVDGQQRLTTLLLILIKLYHLLKDHKSALEKWVDKKILGQSGYDYHFWICHNSHNKTLQAIYENQIGNIDRSIGITTKNMVENFQIISQFLNLHLTDKHKLETFTFYFLRRLVLINLSVEQTDVPMVFEVINDRGVKLKPFEIIKGKLLGQIDKIVLETEKYNELWEERTKKINEKAEDEVDYFFRFYLKAKFADNRSAGQKFDGDYHRIIFSNEFNSSLALSHNTHGVIRFLEEDFSYYTKLYKTILDHYHSDKVTAFTYNKLNDLDGAFLLILSCCKIDDPEENEKVLLIPQELDRLFSLLQLQGSYDSNTFQEILYRISASIRQSPLDTIRKSFDKELFNELAKRLSSDIDTPLKYSFFKQTGVGLNTRFKRYFFARIEEFLAKSLNSNMRHSIVDLVSKTGAKTGFHIEHILAHNSENLSLFNNDEDSFEQERNRLGGILLLKGKDNISSNAESYSKKLATYAGTLIWNETLRADSYKSKLDMTSLKNSYKLELKPIDRFTPEALESRQYILFQLASIIWK